MRSWTRLGTGVALAATTAVVTLGGAAGASPSRAGASPSRAGASPSQAGASPSQAGPGTQGHAVFVQTDGLTGNQVVAYRRAADGTLTLVHTYDTGGNGGMLGGSVVDHLASQGSLVYDSSHRLLLAVNGGSNTLSVFSVDGDHLRLRQIVPSGGDFPVSVAVDRDLVYVLNAENGGAIQGFVVRDDHLAKLAGSNRALGLDATATPQFTNTPGQVAFSPEGSQLLVTTKDNGNDIDVFRIGASGRPSATAVINSEPGTVPFGVAFDQRGDVVVAEAGTDAVATFRLGATGTLRPIDSVATAQAATCWVTAARGFLYASNAGSGTVSGFAASGGELTSLGSTATNTGTVDSTAEGRFLYVQTGGTGVVDEYVVHADGSLGQVGSVTVAGAVGGEGIAAT